ncbi:helix-turn-helix domain-containing protein [Streptomyces sp. NPDC006975]|uniref:helix-turn-helix domain-containing protein n=1 Tax=Streptomyces sp. NPDC006975 TaxID=3154310 RepID=UPI003454FF6B
MLRAPVSERRLDILRWLKHPPAPTPARTRRPGDPTPDGTPAPDPLTAPHGVTADAVAAGLGLPPRLVRADLALLARVGVLKVRRTGVHTYYRRDEIRIAEVARMFEKGW